MDKQFNTEIASQICAGGKTILTHKLRVKRFCFK